MGAIFNHMENFKQMLSLNQQPQTHVFNGIIFRILYLTSTINVCKKWFAYTSTGLGLNVVWPKSALPCCNEVVEVARCCNSITECAMLFRDILHQQDYNLHDKFCDSQVLEHSWCQGHIPVPFVHFFSMLLSDATGKFAQSQYSGVQRHREVCVKPVYRLPTSYGLSAIFWI